MKEKKSLITIIKENTINSAAICTTSIPLVYCIMSFTDKNYNLGKIIEQPVPYLIPIGITLGASTGQALIDYFQIPNIVDILEKNAIKYCKEEAKDPQNYID